LFRGRRLALVPVIAVLGGLVAMATALPASGAASGASSSHRSGHLTVGVEVLHFRADGRRAIATGLVTARLTQGGRSDTIRQRVAVIAAAGRSCNILSLYLKQLKLSLLGLNANLSKVQLTLTGDPGGGVLGSLFCKLARAKVSTARASAVRAINARMSREHQNFVRFSTELSAHTAAAAGQTCQVLNLVLGPLKLQLLGLIVSLNQVTLNVTATNGGGVLGDLFCQLADNAPATTTSTTPTTTTTTTTTGTTTTGTTTTGTTTTGTTTTP
jgi:hypothetical protein